MKANTKKAFEVILALALFGAITAGIIFACWKVSIRDGYKESKERKVEFYKSEWARFEWDDPDDYSSDIQQGTVYYHDGFKSIRTYVLDKDGGYPIMANAVLVYPNERVSNG